MILVKESLGRGYMVWDRAAEIEFVRPGRGTVAAAFELDAATLDAIAAEAAGGERVLKWFETDVVDAGGELVARVRKQVYVRRKRAQDGSDAAAAPP
jgi:hypothetical protein